MIGNDFVKEMQEALLAQQEHDDPASRASPNVKILQTEALNDWDALVAWMEGAWGRHMPDQGKMSGKSWAGGQTPGGRFCNLFKFRDGRISNLHVYLDPDYTGEDEARFRWGSNRPW